MWMWFIYVEFSVMKDKGTLDYNQPKICSPKKPLKQGGFGNTVVT